MGQMPAAIEAARRWVALSPESKSLGYLALLYMDNNDAESAREAALRALADDPENADANVVHGMALTEKQEVGQARRHFETALHQEPLNGRAWLGLGLSYLYEADYDKAIEALRKAARIYPGNPGTIVALGWAELSARDPAAAQQTFEQAIRVDRNFGESHGGLAAALAMQQKIDEAQAEILIAQRLDRRGFGAEFARSAIMAIQGNQQGAVSALTRLLDQTPPNSLVPLIEQLRIYAAKNAAQPAPTQTRH
jgi:tetratricopeptide (TPR) repeat protein